MDPIGPATFTVLVWGTVAAVLLVFVWVARAVLGGDGPDEGSG